MRNNVSINVSIRVSINVSINVSISLSLNVSFNVSVMLIVKCELNGNFEPRKCAWISEKKLIWQIE